MNRLIRYCLQSLALALSAAVIAAVVLLGGACPAQAMGVTQLPADAGLSGSAAPLGPVTLWYPSKAPETSRTMGAFVLKAAWEVVPERGNGALIVLSHGSGGSAITYDDLARVLVDAGFVVAAPEHEGDNWLDQTKTGPASWQQRPAEISRTIDRVMNDRRFAPLLERGRVGVYGMSAGGLTALEFSGATWSLSRLVKHCADHFDEDAAFCGFRELAASGGKLDDATKQRLKGQYVQGAQSGMVDPKDYGFQDSRVKAVVAAVPAAAVIDPASLRTPRVPTALISAESIRCSRPNGTCWRSRSTVSPASLWPRSRAGTICPSFRHCPKRSFAAWDRGLKIPPGSTVLLRFRLCTRRSFSSFSNTCKDAGRPG